MPKIIKNNTVYAAVPSSANGIAYNGTTSGISANTVQGAIDEVVKEKADRVPEPTDYDATSTYNQGDFVIHNNNIYICTFPITIAEAWNSEHWGLVTPDTDYLHSMNPNGAGSFSLNRRTNSTVGAFSTAEGYDCAASDSYAHAEGAGTTASGGASHSEGMNTMASGLYSHAEGSLTIASGTKSHAEGDGTTASGGASHAEGSATTASGNFSHAEGLYTTANHRSQHTFGEYNILDDSTAASANKGNYIEIVGNGTSTSNRSNARTLDWSGNEVLAGTLTASGLNLTGSITDATLTCPRCPITINTSKCYQIGNIIFYSAKFAFGDTVYETTGGLYFFLNKVTINDFCWGEMFYDTGDLIYKVSKGASTNMWVTSGTTRYMPNDAKGKSNVFLNLIVVKV